MLKIDHYANRFRAVCERGNIANNISFLAEEYGKILNEINELYAGGERDMHLKVLDSSFDMTVRELTMEFSIFLRSPQLERGYRFQDELNRIRLTFSNAEMDVDVYHLPSFEMGYMNQGNVLLKEIHSMFYNARDYAVENGSIGPSGYNDITGSSTTVTYMDLKIMDEDGIRQEIDRFMSYANKTDKVEENKMFDVINKSRLSDSAKNFFNSMIENVCEHYKNDEKILNGYWDMIRQCGLTLAELPEHMKTYDDYILFGKV